MDAVSAPARAMAPLVSVLVLAAPAPMQDREQLRAFCAFLRQQRVEARLELLDADSDDDGPQRWLAAAADVHWVLVVASPGFVARRSEPIAAVVPYAARYNVVPVVLPGGRSEELPAWAVPEHRQVVTVADLSAEGAESLLRIVIPLMAGPPPAADAEAEPATAAAPRPQPSGAAAPPPPYSDPAAIEAAIEAARGSLQHLQIDIGAGGRLEVASERTARLTLGVYVRRFRTRLRQRAARPAPGRVPETPEPRRLHATVLDAHGRDRHHAFAPGQRHTVVLAIRSSGSGIVAARALPEEAVTFDEPFGASLDVEVVVDGPDGTVALRRPLRLPPSGPSSEVRVPVDVAADATEVTATVLVFQRATLLQSAQLRGPVRAADVAVGGLGIRLETDAELTPDLASPTVEMDASLCFNVGHRGDVLLVDAAGQERMLVLGGLDRFRDDVVETLRIALDRDDVEGTERGSQQQVELLRSLARRGHTLYQALESQLHGATIGPRIQLVSAEDEVVPLEFVYDYGLPSENATLCAHWLDALATGRCRCRPRSGSVRTICPLGFWGLRFVIERQVASTTAVGLAGDPSPGQMRPGHETLPPLDRVLFAATTRVDEVNRGERRRTVELLTQCLGERAVEVSSWRAWHRAVRDHRPGVLLSLPHTDEIGGLVALQIGRRSIREVAAMTEDYVVAPGTGVGPVVMLLGCSTAAADISWQSAVAAFRRRGASVVIGTLVETLGRQTAPLARHVAEQMWGRERVRHETIGEVVQALRRDAVSSGATLGMSLVAFGETGWRVPEGG